MSIPSSPLSFPSSSTSTDPMSFPAVRILGVYRRYKYRQDYRSLKQLITFCNDQYQRNPWLILRTILHRTEYINLYQLKDTLFPYVRFRLYQLYPVWPPLILYRIYTRTPTIDLGYFSPRLTYYVSAEGEDSSREVKKEENRNNVTTPSRPSSSSSSSSLNLSPTRVLPSVFFIDNEDDDNPTVSLRLKVGKRSVPVVVKEPILNTTGTLYQANPCRTNPWRCITCSTVEMMEDNTITTVSLPFSASRILRYGKQYCSLHHRSMDQCILIRRRRSRSFGDRRSFSPPTVVPSLLPRVPSTTGSTVSLSSVSTEAYSLPLTSTSSNPVPWSSPPPSLSSSSSSSSRSTVSFRSPSANDRRPRRQQPRRSLPYFYDNKHNDGGTVDKDHFSSVSSPPIKAEMIDSSSPTDTARKDEEDSFSVTTRMGGITKDREEYFTIPSIDTDNDEKETKDLLEWIDAFDYRQYSEYWLRTGTLVTFTE